MNSTATANGIAAGKAYVQNNLSAFNLVTQTAYNTALTDMNSTATANGIAAGKAYVQNNLSAFNLVTQSQYDTDIATAKVSGRDMVLSSPSGYGLVSTSDLNSSVAQALTSGITQGKQYVQDNLSEFGLTTITAMNTAVIDANTTAVSDTMAKCSANPSSCGIDLSATENITTEYINNLDTGWTLTGTAKNITDLTVFESAKTVWIYSNGLWSAYSSNQTTQQAIKDANINILTSISTNSGIWVLK